MHGIGVGPPTILLTDPEIWSVNTQISTGIGLTMSHHTNVHELIASKYALLYLLHAHSTAKNPLHACHKRLVVVIMGVV